MVCDLAEYYHIYNYKELPVRYLATLVAGLGANSRTIRKISGTKIPLEIMLMAGILDNLSLLVWSKTKDAQKGRNKPKSILQQITEDKKESNVVAFDTGAEFDRYREQLIANNKANKEK